MHTLIWLRTTLSARAYLIRRFSQGKAVAYTPGTTESWNSARATISTYSVLNPHQMDAWSVQRQLPLPSDHFRATRAQWHSKRDVIWQIINWVSTQADRSSTSALNARVNLLANSLSNSIWSTGIRTTNPTNANIVHFDTKRNAPGSNMKRDTASSLFS